MDDSEAGTVSLLVSGAITPHQYTRARADGPLTSESISEQTEVIVHDPENDGVRHARIAHAGRVLEDCDLRDENSRLKKLVVDLSLDKDMPQSVIRKKFTGLVARRAEVGRLMAMPRSSGRYRSRRDDSQIQERVRELAREHLRFGYRRLHLHLRAEMGVNHKKVQRIDRQLGLSLKSTRRKHSQDRADALRQMQGPERSYRQRRTPP